MDPVPVDGDRRVFSGADGKLHRVHHDPAKLDASGIIDGVNRTPMLATEPGSRRLWMMPAHDLIE